MSNFWIIIEIKILAIFLLSLFLAILNGKSFILSMIFLSLFSQSNFIGLNCIKIVFSFVIFVSIWLNFFFLFLFIFILNKLFFLGLLSSPLFCDLFSFSNNLVFIDFFLFWFKVNLLNSFSFLFIFFFFFFIGSNIIFFFVFWILFVFLIMHKFLLLSIILFFIINAFNFGIS